MKYSIELLKKDTMKEIVALRKHATKEELEKLSLTLLDPDNKYNCIYGQITGDCTSERASELIMKSCKRYFTGRKFPMNRTFSYCLEDNEAINAVNGTEIPYVKTVEDMRKDRIMLTHFSSIETYILLKNANLKGVIEYLRGETDTLEL